MSRVVKAFVFWLIALAIPVQGMAAVAVPLCPPVHHPDMSASLDQPAAHDAGVSGHVGTTDHRLHHRAAVDQAADDGGAPHGDAGPAGHGMHNCCTAAGAMAAVTLTGIETQAAARSLAPLHPEAQAYGGVTPDGLDRPPKSILA